MKHFQFVSIEGTGIIRAALPEDLQAKVYDPTASGTFANICVML